MTPIVPRVAVFSYSNQFKAFKTSHTFDWFAKGFETHFFNSDVSKDILHNYKFSILIFIGSPLPFKKAFSSTIPKIQASSIEEISGDFIYEVYSKSSILDLNPHISIFTPAHKTFDKFFRTYNSVINQSYSEWEWIILDDSPTDENYEFIKKIVKNDYRIKLYKCNRQDSFVGSTKRQAASLCNGKYLLELDHDDELHHMALEYTLAAFNKYPDAGFCYSNSCETFETGGNVSYGNNFAMGYGRHYPFFYKGRDLIGSDTPINASTMRHIVGVPNHLRCWERNLYFKIQRHNNKLPIVDDYELLIRTFLHTKMVHVPEVLYIQYMNSGGNNTQEPRRAEIQRLVESVQKIYDKAIHERVLELGGNDWLWNDEKKESFIYSFHPKERTTLAYVYKI